MSSKARQGKQYVRIVDLPEVTKLTGLSRAAIYCLMRKGLFPSQHFIRQRAVGWLENEVNAWVKKYFS